jgi:hypothetical protein
VGELARRAGADKELETVRAQLEEMREKSRQRLGKTVRAAARAGA